MQPKAKWVRRSDSAGVWTAGLGVFCLYVETDTGKCSIYANRTSLSPGGATRFVLWRTLVPTPCDAPDLMRLCEDELARRLRAVADTMAGDELAPTRATPTSYPVDCVRISFGASPAPQHELHADISGSVYHSGGASRHDDRVNITSYAQLCDTLDRLPSTLEVERTCTDGRWLWRKVDCDFYAMAQERAGIAQVKYYSRDDLDSVPYNSSATYRVVCRPLKGNI